jgi:hypothetical protein
VLVLVSGFSEIFIGIVSLVEEVFVDKDCG